MAGDRVQLAIDVAAEMSGGSQTIAQLDQIATQFTRGGSDARVFDEALARVSDEMRSAADSSKQLDAAVMAASKSVARAESNLSQLEGEAKAAAAANRGVVPPSLASDVKKAAAALTAERRALSGLEADAKRAAAAQTRLAKTSRNVTRVQKRHRDRLGDITRDLATFRGALGDVGGPLGEFGERLLFPVQAFADLNEYMGKGTAIATVAVVGYAAVAAAVALVGIAAAAAVTGIAAMGVALANSARSARLNLEALSALDPALAGLGGTMRDVGLATGVADADMIRYSRSLREAGVSAADLPRALLAVATAESAIVGRGDAVIEKMREAKGSIADVASEVEQKFGGIVERKMLSLDVQAATLQRHLGSLFDGLAIEPLLQQIARLVALFDETSTSGKALKFLFETLIQPLVDAATAAMPAIEAAFLGVLAGGLEIYIALKPAFKAVGNLLDDLGVSVDWLEVAFQGARVAVYAVVGVMALLAATTAAVMLPLAILGTVVGAVVVVVGSLGYAAGYAAGFLIDKLGQALSYVSTAVSDALGALGAMVTAAASVGGDIVRGVASGITGAASSVVQAMTSAVGGAIDAAKRKLGIASPSKVAEDVVGEPIGEGVAGGIDNSAQAVARSMDELVAPVQAGSIANDPDVTRAIGGSVDNSRSSVGPSVSIAGDVIIGGEKANKEAFAEWLTAVLRGDAIMVGAA